MYNREEIKEQFKEVIRHSQGIDNPKVDDLFNRWEKSKKKFIDRFGGLIYEWSEPIEFTLDEGQKRQSAMEFASCVQDTFNNTDLAEFIDMNLNSFYDNVVSNSGDKGVPKGMKLIKAFKYFETNEMTLHHLQDMASQLIQQNKIKGTLCFSVHPLDYLSSSCNTYNWRSCHALDGEYRAGNLSYMVDETTFMVYLKGVDDVAIPGFPSSVPWNSKKWRMLIHASTNDELMFAGRQYPFTSSNGLDIVLNVYNNIIGKNKNPYSYSSKYYPWENNYVESVGNDKLYGKYFVFDRKLFLLDEYVTVGMGALNYNDILHSTCYTKPYYTILNFADWHDKPPKIEIGAYVNCLHCEENDITMSETMRCDDCEISNGFEVNEHISYCDCCGARVFYDDGFYVHDDFVCEECFNRYTFQCDCCGEPAYNEEKKYIPPRKDGDEELWICDWCYQNQPELWKGVNIDG